MTDFRYPDRVRRLREKLALSIPQKSKDKNAVPLPDAPPCDTVIVSDIENARYLTGFSGSNALLIVTQTAAVFLTDGRYKLQASREVPGWEIVIVPQGSVLAELAGEHLQRLGSRRVGFEAGHLSYNGYQALEKAMPESVELVGRSGLVESVRAIKDADEVAKIRAAIAIADACFDFIRETLRAGMTEKELAWEMETFMRHTKGAPRLSFDSIIGSGPQSALIHGRPSDRVIGSSGAPEFLLCDFGCELNGYCSDITRTFVVGGEPTDKQRDLYDAVLRSQLAAIAAIKPGADGKGVDAVAREVLTQAGYGEAFGHGLGHQLGRIVHDGPAFSQKAEVTLEAGMIVTIEPGAYLEDLGGVRIEDDILVTETGYDVLTKSPKELIVLPLR